MRRLIGAVWTLSKPKPKPIHTHTHTPYMPKKDKPKLGPAFQKIAPTPAVEVQTSPTDYMTWAREAINLAQFFSDCAIDGEPHARQVHDNLDTTIEALYNWLDPEMGQSV